MEQTYTITLIDAYGLWNYVTHIELDDIAEFIDWLIGAGGRVLRVSAQ